MTGLLDGLNPVRPLYTLAPPGCAFWSTYDERASASSITLKCARDSARHGIDRMEHPLNVTMLFAFAYACQVTSWTTLNDDVMGGCSTCKIEHHEPGRALFTGTTSLDNGGGFASIRANIGPNATANSDGIALRVRGDGRTFWLLVSENGFPARVCYEVWWLANDPVAVRGHAFQPTWTPPPSAATFCQPDTIHWLADWRQEEWRVHPVGGLDRGDPRGMINRNRTPLRTTSAALRHWQQMTVPLGGSHAAFRERRDRATAEPSTNRPSPSSRAA